MNVVLEGAVIGFGVIGAVCAGKAAQTLVERSGGTKAEALASGCVGAGIAMAVLPAAAVGGLYVCGVKGYAAFQNRDAVVSQARAQLADAKAHVAGVATKLGRKAKPEVAAVA
jgi:hypothetical protein